MGALKRKIFLINPKFQINIIGHFVGLSLISISAFYAANTWFFYKFLQMGKDMGMPSNHVFFQFLHAQKMQMNWIFVGISLLVIAIQCIGGLILSHKVAGPIYRLCQHLKGIKDGQATRPLSFREGDYFQEIPSHINPLLNKAEKTNDDCDKAA